MAAAAKSTARDIRAENAIVAYTVSINSRFGAWMNSAQLVPGIGE